MYVVYILPKNPWIAKWTNSKKKMVSFLFSGIFHLEELVKFTVGTFTSACFMVGSGENPIEQIHGVIFVGPEKMADTKKGFTGVMTHLVFGPTLFISGIIY